MSKVVNEQMVRLP